MNRLLGPASLLVVGLVFCLMFSSPASAAPFTGTPSNGLGTLPNPRFGTLIDFDEISTEQEGFATLPTNNYAPAVVSIGELINGALFPLTVLPLSNQSPDNYVFAEDPAGATLTHTIQIQFKDFQARVGIGIIDDAGGQAIQIFDKDHNPIENSYSPQFSGGNAYAGFERAAADITFLEISGELFALDDLQFSSVPVPEPTSVLLLISGLAGIGLVRQKSRTGA